MNPLTPSPSIPGAASTNDTGVGRLVHPKSSPELVLFLTEKQQRPQRVGPMYRAIALARTDAEEYLRQRATNEITTTYKLPRLAAEVLAGRGFTTGPELAAYLSEPTRSLANPHRIMGVERATRLLCSAIRANDLVAFVGDFDVDGATSVAQAVRVWRHYRAPYVYHVPCRLEEGYGLSLKAVEYAHKCGAKILVSLDIGSSNHEAIARAQLLGIRVVVVDHHLGDELNSLPADVLINPHQHGCGFENGTLCASGLTHFLMRSIIAQQGEQWADTLLPLAMLGTIADVVPLRGENRAIAAQGLLACQTTELVGIRALTAGSKSTEAQDVAYGSGPILNALGRVRRRGGKSAVRLLVTDNATQAAKLVPLFQKVNSHRKKIENDMVQLAINEIETHSELPNVIVLSHVKFHPGVVGLVCSRLVERYRRPVILLQEREDGTLRGSGRSVEGLNIKEQLDICKRELTRYGGHPQAVGVALNFEQLEHFRWRINFSTPLTVSPGIQADKTVSLRAFARDQSRIIDDLKALGPTGRGNDPASFLARKVRVVAAYRIGHRHTLVILREGRKDAVLVEGYFWHTPDHPLIIDPHGTPSLNRDGTMRLPIHKHAVLDIVYRPMRLRGRDILRGSASAKVELVAAQHARL